MLCRASKARNTASDVVPQTFNILRLKTRVIRMDEIDRVIDLLVNEALVRQTVIRFPAVGYCSSAWPAVWHELSIYYHTYNLCIKQTVYQFNKN